MEESEEILLNSLADSGVPIPAGVSLIKDLTPASLVSICSNSLHLILNTSSYATVLPDSMADRFNLCSDLASALKNLGYIGPLTFHKFLYPSEEDMHKLVRFLVGRLSQSSESGKSFDKKNIHTSALVEENLNNPSKDCKEKVDNEGLYSHKEEVMTRLEDLGLKNEVLENSRVGKQDSSKDKLNIVKNGKGSIENMEESKNHVSELEQKLTSPQEHSSKEVNADSLDLQLLEEEYELLKAAVNMAFDDQHPVDFYITQLTEQIESRKHNLVDLESRWDALRKPLEEKRRSLEEALYAAKPEGQEKLQKLKEIELETQSILAETKKRDEELSKLSIDIEKQPKLASRRSYINRINEITKNSRKQDIDIERILKETRELQLESNSIQESLHRTYAVVDETVFREAKKDPVGQQAYRMLTSIHESFQQMSEKILATDRARREESDYEAKLAAMASKSLNIDKLQADLDAIRRENEFLQQNLHNTSIVNADH